MEDIEAVIEEFERKNARQGYLEDLRRIETKSDTLLARVSACHKKAIALIKDLKTVLEADN